MRLSRRGQPPSPNRSLRRVRYAQAIVFGAIALALAAALLWTFSVVDAVFRTAATGEGERLLHAMRSLERGPHFDPRTLDAAVGRLQADGLRCVAVFDRARHSIERAGDCVHTEAALESLFLSARPGELVKEGGRYIMVHQLPPLPPPEFLGGRVPPPPPHEFLVEFEPLQAIALRRAATRSLVAGLVATAALIIATVIFWRVSSRAERLQQAMERDRRLAGLGEMSAVLAHEIRNPLASLKGHAQLLLESLPAQQRDREQAEWVVRESVRLEALCEDLLSLVRSDRVERVPVDPAGLLREAAEAVDAEGIRVASAGAPARWALDRARMHQVLTNLLRNAVQASPAGQPVEASVALRRGALTFHVRDFGAGVAPGDEERIFEPFHTTRLRGTGLGLAVARRVVELHGGSIAARNHPQGGADFEVVIPPVAAA